MKLNEVQEAIWEQVKQDLTDEPVASPDHVKRMTTWCQKLGPKEAADMDTLVSGALTHDIGVPIDRKTHYVVGRARAAEIMKKAGLPEEKLKKALHVLESHSRYGGPNPQTIEAKVGQDADALEYIGAIGIIRAVVRGLNDGSFDGKATSFPDYLRTVLAKVEGTFYTEQAREIGNKRLEYMKQFLQHIEKELNHEI